MTTKELTQHYRDVITKDHVYEVPAEQADTAAHDTPDYGRHLMWMLDQMDRMPLDTEAAREKWNRWLGFVQGTLWAADYTTIDEMRSDTRGLSYE